MHVSVPNLRSIATRIRGGDSKQPAMPRIAARPAAVDSEVREQHILHNMASTAKGFSACVR